jgi:hypothetical protein
VNRKLVKNKKNDKFFRNRERVSKQLFKWFTKFHGTDEIGDRSAGDS